MPSKQAPEVTLLASSLPVQKQQYIEGWGQDYSALQLHIASCATCMLE